MKIRISSSGHGLLVMWVIIAAFTIFQAKAISTAQERNLVLFILIPILVVFTLDLMKMRTLSYDSEFIYLEGLLKKEQVAYAAIIKVKRSVFRYYNGSRLNYGYVLIYCDESGKRRSCHFYITSSNTDLWERFKYKITQSNPAIEINE